MPQANDCIWVLESAPLHPAGEPVWSPDLAGASMATCFGCSEAGEAVAEAVSGAQGCDRLYRVEKYVRASGSTEAEDEALELAHSLATEGAALELMSRCITRRDSRDRIWADLRTALRDTSQVERYLALRGLLERDPHVPYLVRVRDESEATA